MLRNNTPSVNLTLFTAVVLLSIIGTLLFSSGATVKAYNGAYLIDDAVFLDSRSMSRSEIQAFLNNRNSGLRNMSFTFDCYGSNSREREWYSAIGAPCDRRTSAADIIYYVSRIYGINPRVVMATMQKEQSIITAANPTQWQLDWAMGYGCPTENGCANGDFAQGFFRQLDHGAWVLRWHYERASGNNTWWRASNGWTCDRTGQPIRFYAPSLFPRQNVRFYDQNGVRYRTYFIENAATSSMYCYTPHTYNNPRGEHGRAAYGSRGMYYSGSYNFVLFFQNWWGSSSLYGKINFEPMVRPHAMEVRRDTFKKDPLSNQDIDLHNQLERGQKIYFNDKVDFNGKTYLRTYHDSERGFRKAVLLSDLREVDITYRPLDIPRTLKIRQDTYKQDPVTGRQIDSRLRSGQKIYFTYKVSYDGRSYYRTAHDSERGYGKGILVSDLEEIELEFEPMVIPRAMEMRRDEYKKDPSTNRDIDKHNLLRRGQTIYFVDKIDIGNKTYLRTAFDSERAYPKGILLSDLQERPVSFENMVQPREMITNRGTYPKDPATGRRVGDKIDRNTTIKFSEKVDIGNKTYLRIESEIHPRVSVGILLNRLSEVE